MSATKKLDLIRKWGIAEADLIISAAEQVAKESLLQRAGATEIADLVSSEFTIDPTHMSDKEFIKYLNRLAKRAERQIISDDV